MAFLAAVALNLPWVASQPAAAHSNALWQVVHGFCVPGEKGMHDPSPCTAVDLSNGVDRGFAVLKDLRRRTQVLVVPTTRITGIEDPAVLVANAPNYWQFAWEARRYVEARAGVEMPRDDVGLAVNSEPGRTQDQLHIHIDCIRPDVKLALGKNEAGIGKSWSLLRVSLAGRRYMAMRVEGADLTAVEPFRLLAAGLPSARKDMASQTLVVVGASFKKGGTGFFLLNDHADAASRDEATGEDLLDHSCAVLKHQLHP